MVRKLLSFCGLSALVFMCTVIARRNASFDMAIYRKILKSIVNLLFYGLRQRLAPLRNEDVVTIASESCSKISLAVLPLLMLFIGLNLSSCNSSKHNLHKNLSKEDSKNLHYKGHYKIGKPYTIKGKSYTPKNLNNYTQVGMASWYGGKDGFHGKKTANGDKYDKNLLTAAHKTLPLPCLIKVTNLANKKSLIVMVNDRGPFKKGRIIDVSEKAAGILGFKKAGVAKVKIEYLPAATDKFLKKLALKPKENSLAKKKPKNEICSVNCHIKLVNLEHKLALTP